VSKALSTRENLEDCVFVFIFVFVTSFLFGVNQMGKNRRGREKGIMFVNVQEKQSGQLLCIGW
jgi:hypothetical protein